MSEGGMFDSFFKKATASVKVMAKDAMQGTASLVHKVSETDVQGVARRLTHKVMEKADSSYTNVEELPEVESAMLNLKQTDQAYRELHAVLLESFVAQSKAASRQLRAANRADVIGRDLETEAVGGGLCSFGNHLTVSAERAQELNGVREGAEVEERARDDFGSRVYDTPAAKLISSLDSFIHTELAQALQARVKYKDTRREVSIYTKKVADLEAKGLAEKAEEAKAQVAEGTKRMDTDREELLKHFMGVEQRKPALQSVVQAYLHAQLQYHQQCLMSAEHAIAAVGGAAP
eukprot:CAMPEP_0173384446 /NCGR_PEP_ID=MMETSP1356-20130122/7014_1 /TAXON_ID=77927 ORGANISM="Hemiselmis virescens, Strain PCC157" /NCGR_SAMPLE_ID=MMETSP1356 /ASSEMBLY_ACC=CAM_ASM_000847 /LENGTH=290 /DNA_ID=CAMNT_0014339793 /DNA_START=45 /DNA_END=917 /DNA_ORIENTATION=-